MNIRVSENRDSVLISHKGNNEPHGKTEKNTKKGSIFVGDNENISSVEQRKGRARKEAWKLVSKAWENDRGFDDALEENNKQYDKLMEERHRLLDAKESAVNVYEGLKEELGDTKEGKEELLEAVNMVKHMTKATMQVDKQIKAVVYNSQEISKEQLKQHGMVDAQNAAEDLLMQESQGIMSDLMNDAKSHIDEQNKELEEEQKENREKAEERQEEIAKVRQKRLDEEARMLGTEEAIKKANRERKTSEVKNSGMDEFVDMNVKVTNVSSIQDGLDEIKNRMNLLEADLKGIKVDETL